MPRANTSTGQVFLKEDGWSKNPNQPGVGGDPCSRLTPGSQEEIICQLRKLNKQREMMVGEPFSQTRNLLLSSGEQARASQLGNKIWALEKELRSYAKKGKPKKQKQPKKYKKAEKPVPAAETVETSGLPEYARGLGTEAALAYIGQPSDYPEAQLLRQLEEEEWVWPEEELEEEEEEEWPEEEEEEEEYQAGGYVPETGEAFLHEGEFVLPEEVVEDIGQEELEQITEESKECPPGYKWSDELQQCVRYITSEDIPPSPRPPRAPVSPRRSPWKPEAKQLSEEEIARALTTEEAIKELSRPIKVPPKATQQDIEAIQEEMDNRKTRAIGLKAKLEAWEQNKKAKVSEEAKDQTLRREDEFQRLRDEHPDLGEYITDFQKTNDLEGLNQFIWQHVTKQVEVPEHPRITKEKEKKAREQKGETREKERKTKEKAGIEARETEAAKQLFEAKYGEPFISGPSKGLLKKEEKKRVAEEKAAAKPPKDYSESPGFQQIDKYYRDTDLAKPFSAVVQKGISPTALKGEIRNRIFNPDGTINARYVPDYLIDDIMEQEKFIKMLQLSPLERKKLEEYFTKAYKKKR